MNIDNLNILLQEAISNATKTVDYLLLAKAIESLSMGQIRSVSTFANLPSAASNEGLLVFVTADERLYWSTGADWYSIVSDNKGLLYAWGNNSFGELGDGTITSRSSPVLVVGAFTDWVQLSAGNDHSLGVRSNGTAWAWGANTYGRLGDNTLTSRLSPVSVVGGFTDWVQMTAGSTHSLGVRSNGTVWAWGNNNQGRIGDGTTTSRSSPVSVVGGFTDWVQASAGSSHSLGLRANGSVWAWGYNGNGRLGDDTTVIDRSSPVSVVGGFSDWISVSAGGTHSLGVRSNGTAWAWGNNDQGRLGDNTVTSRSSPVSVVGGFTDWVQASAGSSHSLGLRTNGSAWAWGLNSNGRLGDGTNIARSSPVSVVGGFTNWVQLSAGIHSLGLRANGSAWAWGANGDGRLGDGTTTVRSSPVSVVGGFTDWVQLSAGNFHSIGIRKTDFT